MTYFSALPVVETQVGIAIESVRGTPEAPDYWLPIMGPKYVPDVQLLPDAGLRGSMVTLYDEVPGLRFDSHAWDAYPFLDSFPVFLRALLGSKDKVQARTPLTTLVAEAKSPDKKIIVVEKLSEGLVVVLDEGGAEEETTTLGKETKIKAGEWEYVVVALTKKHAIGATVSGPTELVKEAVAGATVIFVPYKVEAGQYLVIGTIAGEQETVLVVGAPTESKAGEWKTNIVYPLAFTHKAKASVVGLTGHAFSLLNNAPAEGNQPPSCTITDYAGEENWRQLARAQLNAINIKGSADALPTVAVDWFADKAITPAPPSATYSTAEAPPGWTAVAAIGGTQIGYMVNWEFDLKRNVKNIPGVTGNQNWYQHFAGPLEATAKVTVLEDRKALWLTAYENGELESIDLTLSDVKSGFALNLHSSSLKFIKGSLDRSKEWVEIPLEAQLIPSEADALAGGVSPIVATVANAVSTEY
jgi:hypothetical protein